MLKHRGCPKPRAPHRAADERTLAERLRDEADRLALTDPVLAAWLAKLAANGQEAPATTTTT